MYVKPQSGFQIKNYVNFTSYKEHSVAESKMERNERMKRGRRLPAPESELKGVPNEIFQCLITHRKREMEMKTTKSRKNLIKQL
jgi:hypothetical protein